MSTFFKIACPECHKSLKVPDKLAGKSRACPYCNATVRIPETPSEESVDTIPDFEVVPRARSQRSPSAKKAAAKEAIHLRPKKSWFRSSNESASSDVSLLLSGLIGVAVTVVWYAIMFPFQGSYFGALFWQRGPIPFPTTMLMFWAAAILVLKWMRLKEQKNAMLLDVLPTEISPKITLESLDGFIQHINQLPGASGDSFLINRVTRGIEHFRVRKSASETVTMMESQSAIDANNVAGSYTVVKVFIWSLPILGFIGTVMGVSTAVASLAGSLSGGESMDAMKAALQDVFAGLGTAFDTTLLALVMSMLVKIPASALQQSEDDLITSVDEYCNESFLRRLNDQRSDVDTGTSHGDIANFRKAVEEALGTRHAELESWLNKLDKIGERISDQVASGWDKVNGRIEQQQQKHVAVLNQQQLDQQARLQAQLDQMANAADKIQAAMTDLAEQTKRLQTQVNDTFAQTHTSINQQLSGVATGLSSLGGVLQRLGNEQVIVQQVTAEPSRSWFSRKRTHRNGR